MSVISEAVTKAFDFSVDKFPLSGPDNMKTDHYGLFRSDNLACVGNTVSSRYTPHNSDDVIAIAEAASGLFDGDIKVQCEWRRGHYVNIMPSDDHRRSVAGTKDTILPRVIIRAGFDGKAFQAQFGLFRDMCSNLAMLRNVENTTVHIRHNSNLRDHMDATINDLKGLENGWESMVAYINHMSTVSVDPNEFIDRIFPANPNMKPGKETTIYNNRINAIKSRIRIEHFHLTQQQLMSNDKISGWMAYNGIQGYIQHDASRSKKASDWDRIIMASDDRYVKTAEKIIAEQMAV